MSTDLATFRNRLDSLDVDALTEPLGWCCRVCGGRMTKPTAPADADRLAYALDSLMDAARQHHAAGCGAL